MIVLLAAAFLLVAFGGSRLAHAQATVTVVNLDGPGEGFNDPSPPDADSTAGGNTGTTLGEQRLIAAQFAADLWGSIVDSNVEIRVGANFDPLPCNAISAVLGAAGANTLHGNFPGAPVAYTWYPAALANSLAEFDLSPARDDIGATFNSSIDTTCPFLWYYGLDANPPFGTIDFIFVVLHELGHGLGFQTYVNLSTGAKLFGHDDTFMLNLEDHSTADLYPDMTDAERVAASTNTGNLHWVGLNVIEDSVRLTEGRDEPSGHVEMHAPSPQQPGSSVSHFSTSLSPDELMEPYYIDANHDVGLTKALMEDIGWVTVDISKLMVVRERTGGKYKLHIYEIPGTVGGNTGPAIASDLNIGRNVMDIGGGEYDGNSGYELVVMRGDLESTSIEKLYVYDLPAEIGGNTGSAIASDNRIGKTNRYMTVGNFDGDSDTELALLRYVEARDIYRLFVYDMPTTVGGNTGPPIASDRNMGRNIVGIASADFDSDPEDELVIVRVAPASGRHKLYIYDVPATVGGNTGPSIASDTNIGKNIINCGVAAGNFDDDPEPEVAVVRLRASGRHKLVIYDAPAYVGDDTGPPIATDNDIGKNIEAIAACDFTPVP